MPSLQHTLFLKRLKWLFPLVTLATVFSYFFLDKPLAYHFASPNSTLKLLASTVNIIIAPSPNILLWLIAFFATKYIFRHIRIAYEILFVSISLNVSNLIGLIIKYFSARLRPKYLLQDGSFGFAAITGLKFSQYSFPSGHAVTIFTIMCAFSILHRKYTSLFLSVGFLLAFCRVIVNAHYLSDVIAAFGIAMICTETVFVYMKKDFHTFSLMKF